MTACGDGETTHNEEKRGPSADMVVVQFVEVEEIDYVKPIIATGTIAAKQTSLIGPLVEGVIDDIYVRVGDRVKKGDHLFQTRTKDYERQVREAEAAFELAKAERSQAERNFERTEKLAKSHNVSESRLEIALTELEVARARTAQVEATLETARQNLQNTTVLAPFDGSITTRYVDEGVYLTNRFSTGEQSAVIELQESHIVVAVMRAPEAAAAQLKLGLKAKIWITGFEHPFASEVFIINDKIDHRSRTVEFRLPIENADLKIKTGQFVRGQVATESRKIVVLPKSALRGGFSRHFVYKVVGDVAEATDVKIEELDADNVRVLSGLQVGDKVVDGNTSQVFDDAPLSLEISDVAG